ncbi:uncharacterized protein SPPG_08518 [Spizellomyces punctatus DAOM BR117]|uniref:SUI1 domain-containing protein n=1 Tax=Spizellomyces punctatus (strain DAOM BR117) TaxID=645134 RepID=A0A0L0H5F8_SPIPD|nr:uncharacterized protein SPPG_08518 [Spizellomyces punctatus DAOM BR117]KNC96131.1 hypothetical protein SPPG_08518 [Spizellomyces punctatus DAOM BR117]|eukprot:XP_016604171.1 hypothetical protein SPPG_08518 [Spizellomyces punctatus DAOM BR117]
MFRKPFHTKPQSHLRSSDRRKLRAELLAAYPSISEEVVVDLIPTKEGKDGGGEVISAKFVTHGGEQGVLYVVDGQPILWKDLSGCIFPTVYTLWRIPAMLPTIMTHGPVLQKLFDGADLMLPGVIIPAEGFHDFAYGDVAAVTVRGSPIPMAVGTMTVSSADIKKSRYEMRGKGVKILHTFGDYMWAHGNKSEPPELDFVEVGDADTSGSWTELEYNPSGASTPIASETLPASMQNLNLDGSVHGEIEQNNEEAVAKETDTEVKMSPAEMDQLLEQALFTVLKSRLPDDPKAFPMPSSLLYSNYIVPCRPRGTLIDIKQSSYKKVGKFLKAMEKRGLIKLKERGGETMLMSVNRQHPQIIEFVAPRKVAGDEKPAKPEGPADGSRSPTDSSKTNGKSGAGETISAVELYKASAKECRLFEEIGASKDALFTEADLRVAVTEYAEMKNLIDRANPRMVKIDAILCDAVLKKDEYQSVDYLPRDGILQRLTERMQPYHELHLPGREPEIRKGTLKPIQITVEQRQGRKTVTKVVGIERFGIDPEQLAGWLKVRCASSTSVTPIPGKANAAPVYEVMIQGSKVKEVCSVLEKECGMPFTGGKGSAVSSRFVEVVDKTKKK